MGKWRVPGSREVVWIDSREVFLRALPSDSNITFSSPLHPLCPPPPWTIFSMPLVAPSCIGTSGPRLLRVSVRFCRILSSRLSGIFAGCLLTRLRLDPEPSQSLTTIHRHFPTPTSPPSALAISIRTHIFPRRFWFWKHRT